MSFSPPSSLLLSSPPSSTCPSLPPPPLSYSTAKEPSRPSQPQPTHHGSLQVPVRSLAQEAERCDALPAPRPRLGVPVSPLASSCPRFYLLCLRDIICLLPGFLLLSLSLFHFDSFFLCFLWYSVSTLSSSLPPLSHLPSLLYIILWHLCCFLIYSWFSRVTSHSLCFLFCVGSFHPQ